MRERLDGAVSMLAVGLRIDRRLTVSLVFMTILTNVSMTLRALWFALLIDAVVAERPATATAWALVLAASDAVRSWALVGSQMDRQDLHERALQHFQEESMRLAGGPPGIEHHERPEHIDRLAAYRDSFAALAAALGNVVDALANLIRGAVTLGLLVLLHPALVALPLFALPSLWAARRSERIRQAANLEAIAATRRGEHLYRLVVEPASAKEVMVAGVGAELSRRQAALWRQVTTAQERAQRRAAAVTIAGWLVFAVGYGGAVALLVARATAGAAGAGDVLLGVVLAGQVNGQVAVGAGLVGELTQAAVALDHRRWLVAYAERHGAPAPSTDCPTRLSEGISLNAVGFRYPGTDVDVLRDLDLHLPAGSVVALVGENGAGKTTLVKLLARLYQPTSGTIAVDGVDLTAIDLARWRQRITAGFQDFVRYQFRARDVVGVGHLPHRGDPDRIRAAVARASAGDVPAALPDGMQTQLGTGFGGVDISGGQWQKLALARTMMRPQPLLLVLDEPTAALDPVSEHELFARYAAAARDAAAEVGAITLLISHRFSTVRDADLIVVVEDGRIAETGTHDELVAAGGTYAELYGLQAHAYR